MNYLRVLALVLGSFSCLTATAEDQAITEEHRAEIQKMIKLSGVEDMMKPMLGQMVDMFKKQGTQLPEEFWAGMEKKFDTADLLKQLTPVYARHYTLEDVKAINAFYSTPAGKKMVAKLPQIMQESMQIGQAWGQKLGQQLAAEIKAASEGAAK